MFKLSRKGEYAIRAVLHLAIKDGKRTIDEIAKEQEIPVHFLKKIVQTLRVGGILASSKGRNGGVTLRIPADRLTVNEVIEKIEGALFLNECLIHEGACNRDDICPVHEMWKKSQEAVQKVWLAHNFRDLAKRQLQLVEAKVKERETSKVEGW